MLVFLRYFFFLNILTFKIFLRIMIFLKKIANFKIPLLVSLCILTLASAYTIELFLNIPPCKLCTYQRIFIFRCNFSWLYIVSFKKREIIPFFIIITLFVKSRSFTFS